MALNRLKAQLCIPAPYIPHAIEQHINDTGSTKVGV
jgi:hypothetical protein